MIEYPCPKSVLTFAQTVATVDEEKDKTIHCVLLYERDRHRHSVFSRTSKPSFFRDYFDAMSFYCNTPCPASQILHADSDEEMQELIRKMDKDMSDEKWVKEELEPYL